MLASRPTPVISNKLVYNRSATFKPLVSLSSIVFLMDSVESIEKDAELELPYFPAAHGVQLDCPVASASVYVPGAHKLHVPAESVLL